MITVKEKRVWVLFMLNEKEVIEGNKHFIEGIYETFQEAKDAVIHACIVEEQKEENFKIIPKIFYYSE
jgi:hypothetical protein